MTTTSEPAGPVPFRILVVDDERLICELVQSMFEDDDTEVEALNSAAEAIESASHNPPDLILLDVVLPGLDGLAICRLLRTRPGLHDVPIYMLTARARPEDHAQSARAGATGHIEKPFHGNELTDVVTRHRQCQGPGLNRCADAPAPPHRPLRDH